ncbi:MAG: hypothetical protein CM1200mP29_14210 [Verrucomicrobiota bacterium]|nr:MAG: hypothetical protein CM1200mP29_14210 [Verrucomicrobiota bacterium]
MPESRPRLGLNARRLARLNFLVENHLLMAEVSQRRDIDSPTVIHQFAKTVQDEENLAMLTLDVRRLIGHQ